MSAARWWQLKPESDELLTIDALRFLAAAGVVFEHYGAQVLDALGMGAHKARLAPLSLCVDLFFIISGFVICHVYAGRVGTVREYLTFLRRRVARLVPLHWATLLFYVLLGALIAAGWLRTSYPESYDPRCIGPSLLLLHAFSTCPNPAFNFPSWSISAEAAAYALFPLLLLVARAGRAVPFVLSAAGLCALYAASGGEPWFQWTFDLGGLRAPVGFLFGMGLYGVRDLLARLPAAPAALLAALAFFTVGAAAGAHGLLLAPLAYAVALLAVASDMGGPSPGKRFLSRLGPLGQLTYSVYMLQMPVQTVLTAFVGQRVLHLQGYGYAAWALFTMILLLPISLLSLAFYEMPMRRLIAGSKRRSRVRTHVELALPPDASRPR